MDRRTLSTETIENRMETGEWLESVLNYTINME